jgi:hypothetical protein
MKFRIIIVIWGIFFLFHCGKPFVGSGLVLFSTGEVTLSGGNVDQGLVFRASEELVLGSESLADVQFSYPEEGSSSVTVRLDDKSRFTFRETEPKKNKNLTFQLKSGSGTFKISQVQEKLEFTIETPAAGFLINKGDFQIYIASNGDTTIQSLMGSAKGFRRIPEAYLDGIPESFLSEVGDIKDTIESWKKELTAIQTGQTVTIAMSENEERLQKAGLKSVLDKAKQAFVNQSEVAKSPEKIKELASVVKQEFASNVEARKYIETSLKEELPFKVEKLSISDLKKKLKEAESLTYIDPQKITEEKNLRSLIDQRNKEIRASLMKTVALVTSGNVGSVTTADGRVLDCVVYTDYNDPDYYICDPVVGGKKERLYKLDTKLRLNIE